MDVQNVLKNDETGVSKPKVLVIDDEENVCELITLYFEKAGYDVVCSGDGNEGIGHGSHPETGHRYPRPHAAGHGRSGCVQGDPQVQQRSA